MQRSSDADKLALIRARPDLVGAAARAGTLTRESASEQARIDALTREEIARFERDNARYRERFGCITALVLNALHLRGRPAAVRPLATADAVAR